MNSFHIGWLWSSRYTRICFTMCAFNPHIFKKIIIKHQHFAFTKTWFDIYIEAVLCQIGKMSILNENVCAQCKFPHHFVQYTPILQYKTFNVQVLTNALPPYTMKFSTIIMAGVEVE